jgi:hypothetical protein
MTQTRTDVAMVRFRTFHAQHKDAEEALRWARAAANHASDLLAEIERRRWRAEGASS